MTNTLVAMAAALALGFASTQAQAQAQGQAQPQGQNPGPGAPPATGSPAYPPAGGAPAPGYNYPPPPANAAPPSAFGYPPPANAAPPPSAYGYPPPPNAAPPPAYGYPPPPAYGYPPPPNARAPVGYAAYPAPPPADGQRDAAGRPLRHFLLVPFIGIHSYRGDGADDARPGLRLGALIGGQLSQGFSLDGELAIDAETFKDQAGTDSPSSFTFTLALAPLAHVAAGSAEILIGPKIGFWANEYDQTQGTDTFHSSSTGWLLGLNAGVLFPIGRRVSLGGIFAFDVEESDRYCSHMNSNSETCQDVMNAYPSKLVSLSFALRL